MIMHCPANRNGHVGGADSLVNGNFDRNTLGSSTPRDIRTPWDKCGG
jgi:hypothetical protein